MGSNCRLGGRRPFRCRSRQYCLNGAIWSLPLHFLLMIQWQNAGYLSITVFHFCPFRDPVGMSWFSTTGKRFIWKRTESIFCLLHLFAQQCRVNLRISIGTIIILFDFSNYQCTIRAKITNYPFPELLWIPCQRRGSQMPVFEPIAFSDRNNKLLLLEID